MLRAWIMGLGSYVPERVVPNDEIPFLNERHERCAEQQTETDDAWIRELTGIEARRYVPADGSVSCSDLAVKASRCALADAGIEAKDIDWFVPHQAKLRINEAVMQYAKIPPDKVLNTIQMYGNTTAAAVPLTIDHWRREGKVDKGDRVLATVFGSGYTWGTAVFQI